MFWSVGFAAILALAAAAASYIISQRYLKQNQRQAAAINIQLLGSEIEAGLDNVVRFANWICIDTSISDYLKKVMQAQNDKEQLKRLRDHGYPVKSLLDIVQNDNETNTIVYTSKYFQPCSDTFSDRYHFIGPSIRPVTEAVEKTADKTVYISMGTINQNIQFYRNCVSALASTGWQVIISMGTNTDHFDNLPENIRVFESVDQMAVLSIADAFITHCGMNSASEGLYFGVPLVLFPQTPEQDAVAKRTEELGAGIRLKSISEKDILEALTKVLSEPQYKEGAVRVSESFKACGGAPEAKAFLEQVASSRAGA